MDSCSEGHLSNDDGTELVHSAYNACSTNLVIGHISSLFVNALVPLQQQTEEVPSYVLMGVPHENTQQKHTLLSPLGEACSSLDLAEVHEILLILGYKDDEEAATELSFQIWTSEMQERQRCKKHGDAAFRAKDFTAAIDSYTEVGTFQSGTFQSGTLFARRCICYLMSDMAQEALGDAMQSLVHRPALLTAFYLQVAAFKS
ncbi:serine/threonine-protein kinase BSK5-like [Pyrus communis]|uniref:serine/threonine-protein kinase BSK5-like n=1 Tax=Pyrus communis TaxID=23211 RepID=UPI0035C1EFE3